MLSDRSIITELGDVYDERVERRVGGMGYTEIVCWVDEIQVVLASRVEFNGAIITHELYK